MSNEDIASRLVTALLRHQDQFAPILGFALTSANARHLDLSVQNDELKRYPNHEDYTQTLDHISYVW
jgi:hypothetical protein